MFPTSTEWAGTIDAHLNSAQIVLLLVSADFLASDYCYDVEMQRAMERHESRDARVIPVILRPVDWQEAPFGRLQALPTDGKPVATWPNQDAAFVNVVAGIRGAIQELTGRPVAGSAPGSVALDGFNHLALDEQVRLVKMAWQAPLPRLLGFDNCEDETMLVQWRPPHGGCRVLLTSRRAQWDAALGVQTLPLDVGYWGRSIPIRR